MDSYRPLYRKRKRQRFTQCIFFALTGSVLRDRRLWLKERSRHWWSHIALQSFDDSQWKENFRISKYMFDSVCTQLRPYLTSDSCVRESLTVEHRVAVTLYFLATNVEYRTVGNLFGIHKSTVCVIIHEVCEAINTHIFPLVVRFPKDAELKDVVSGFAVKWRFPNCAGAIDATHIPIIGPKVCHSDYVNRKGWYSIIMQAVCDDRYRFTDICVGWPGRVHDARVFANSALRTSAEKLLPNSPEWNVEVGVDDEKVDMPVVLIGDPAYPICPWLLKPYSNRANLGAEESYFNYRLSSARMTIENTFGRFKGRWRRFLKRIDVDVNFVPTLTAAAVALHNICETENEHFEPNWLDGFGENEVGQHNLVQVHQDLNGVAVRKALTAQFARERTNK